MSRGLKVVTASLAILITILIVCLALWVRHGFSARSAPTLMERVVATRIRSLAVPKSVRAMKNPVEKSDATLTEARSHFADHCFPCHGNDGKGQTEMGRLLYPRAPDMTAPATQGKSDGELFYIIKNGIPLSGMPAWGEDTAEDDRESWALVHFIRRLPDLTATELEDMERNNPKGAAEEDVQRFLEGGESPPSGGADHHH